MKEKEEQGMSFIQLLSGQLTEEEEKKLFEQVNKSESDKKHFKQIRNLWYATNRSAIPNPEREWNKFRQRISRRKVNLFWSIGRIAAVFLVGLLSGYFLLKADWDNNKGWQKIMVPNGSCSTVVMADGTEVVLNAGSTMEYPEAFSEDQREVKLSGEGFFKVKHSDSHPFVVNTSDVKIKVYGTEFNVYAFEDAPIHAATLVNGSISYQIAELPGKERLLKPGQRMEYNKQESTVKVKNVDVVPEIAWTKGEFIFNKTPFPELVKRLERWYNVTIHFEEEEFGKSTFTGKFRNHETIWQVLDAIKMTSSIDYQKSGFREFKLTIKSENK